jgi:hypothetical protein
MRFSELRVPESLALFSPELQVLLERPSEQQLSVFRFRTVRLGSTERIYNDVKKKGRTINKKEIAFCLDSDDAWRSADENAKLNPENDDAAGTQIAVTEAVQSFAGVRLSLRETSQIVDNTLEFSFSFQLQELLTANL